MNYRQVAIFGMLILILMYTYNTAKCNTAIMDLPGKITNVFTRTSEVTGTNKLTIDAFPLHLDQFNICTKGEPLIDREFIVSELPHFTKVFEKRPYVKNPGGTKFTHQFAVWCAVRKLKPLHIIESGIYQGYLSWMLRQAAPNAQLIFIDPGPSLRWKDNHSDTVYMTKKNFKDFKNFDWASLNLDFDRTLIYFDDHQSGLVRTLQAYNRGFRYIMFDDNYPLIGDNFSLKLACHVKLKHLHARDVPFRDNFGKTKRPLGVVDLETIDVVFDDLITQYMEFSLPRSSHDEKKEKITYYTEQNRNEGFGSPSKVFFHNIMVCLVKLKWMHILIVGGGSRDALNIEMETIVLHPLSDYLSVGTVKYYNIFIYYLCIVFVFHFDWCVCFNVFLGKGKVIGICAILMCSGMR